MVVFWTLAKRAEQSRYNTLQALSNDAIPRICAHRVHFSRRTYVAVADVVVRDSQRAAVAVQQAAAEALQDAASAA
eukprot:gene4758-2154_t